MMLPFVKTLAANEVCEVSIAGQYLELRSAAAVVARVELLDKSGGVVSLLEEVEATDFVRTSRQFETVRITNGATAQALRFYYGDGDSGSNRFSGVVSGEVALNAATLAALESGDLNAATLNSLKRPEAYTHSGVEGALVAANEPITLIAPGANVGGVIVQHFEALHQTGTGTVQGNLLAKNAAPANVADGVPITGLYQHSTIGGATIYYRAALLRDVFVPAGLGIYWIQNEGTNVNGIRSHRMRVL